MVRGFVVYCLAVMVVLGVVSTSEGQTCVKGQCAVSTVQATGPSVGGDVTPPSVEETPACFGDRFRERKFRPLKWIFRGRFRARR